AARIVSYVSNPPSFATVGEFEAYIREIYKPFGALRDDEWRRMAETSLRRLPDGRITTHYDPAIGSVVASRDFDMWQAYEAVKAPTLVIHAEHSDVALAASVEAMRERGPRAEVFRVSSCGHAPALNVPEQIAPIRAFFARRV